MGEKHWSKDYGRTGGKGGNESQGQHLFWLSSGVLSAVTYHIFCHIYFLFCWVKTMWLALRKPLSIKEHSHFPVLVSWAGTSLMLHFLYTFLLCMYCTTHSSYTLWYTFGHTLYDTFTTDISYTLTTHLSHALLCLLIACHASVASYPWASTWLRQSLDSGRNINLKNRSRRLGIQRSRGWVCKLTCLRLRIEANGSSQLANSFSTSLNSKSPAHPAYIMALGLSLAIKSCMIVPKAQQTGEKCSSIS